MDDLDLRDPLHPLLGRDPELALVHRLLRALHGGLGQSDMPEVVARLAQQYLRIRFLHHQWLVQRPGVSGLAYFSLTKESAALLRPKGTALLANLCSEPYVDAIEPRWEPERTLRHLVAGALTALREARPDQEVGVVYTLMRSASLPFDPRSARAPDPVTHWRQWLRRNRVVVQNFKDAFRQAPELSLLVRGFDVAGAEMGSPPWFVVRHTLLALRQAATAATRRANAGARQLCRPGAPLNIPPPGVTVHAGEDFLHGIDGLRRIDEVSRDLHPGDRLAHALALVTPRSGEPVRQRRIEALLDLAWEQRLLRDGYIGPSGDRSGRHEAWLRDWGLSREHVDGVIQWCELPLDSDLDRSLLRNPQMRRFDWWQDVEAHHAVYPPPALLEAMRSTALRRLTERGVVIESLPSSNLAIGDLADVGRHPFSDFEELGFEVAVGTDDPTSFATDLVREYVRLASADAMKGSNPTAALAEAERRAATSWAARFTLPSTTDPALRKWLLKKAHRHRLGTQWLSPHA